MAVIEQIDIRNPDCVFIDGAWVKPSGNARFALVNPASEDVFFHVPEAQQAEIDRAVAAAREAFDRGPWPRMSVAERAGYLRAIHTELERRRDELARAWTDQMGAVYALSHAITPMVSSYFKFYADLSETFPFEEVHPAMSGEGVALLAREPVGVVAAIVPWNSPLQTAAVKIAPALIAGCTVILKASPETPLEAYILAEAAEAVGLPKGVLNLVTADREVSEMLVRHPGVDKVSFTGSSVAGKKIASICGERVARCTLELGGKSAALVLDDYDVGAVAEAIAGSTCIMSNQVCAALSRVIVTRKNHDALVDAFAGAFGAIRIGDPYGETTQIGPLAMKRQLDRVESYIAKGRAEGGRVVVGGGRPSGLNRGFYIEPTVFADVDNSMTIAREEIFGPVVTILAADDEAHAIDIANDSIFGLNGAVFSNDLERAYGVARQIRSGTVGINGFKTDFNVAFGGFKQSGIGREGGREGLLPYLEAKTIVTDKVPRHLAQAAE